MINASMSPKAAREYIRTNAPLATTSGLCPGFAQANLMIMEEQYAHAFLKFCVANPKACPILHVSEPGDPFPKELGEHIDVRTDVPGYRVYRHGALDSEVLDISALWQDNFVSFYIGCSFSFEESLVQHGVGVRHIEAGTNVPMYRTNIPLKSVAPFHGELVVSMRAMRSSDAIKAVQITTNMSKVHGSPVHIGAPEHIGITNFAQPEFGDAPIVQDTDITSFWACGVTSQLAAMNAKLPIAITHSPGKMLITDRQNWELEYS